MGEGPPLSTRVQRPLPRLLRKRQAVIRRSAPPSPVREKEEPVSVPRLDSRAESPDRLSPRGFGWSDPEGMRGGRAARAFAACRLSMSSVEVDAAPAGPARNPARGCLRGRSPRRDRACLFGPAARTPPAAGHPHGGAAPEHRIPPGRTMPREAPSVGRDEREDKGAAKGGDKCPAWSMSVSAKRAAGVSPPASTPQSGRSARRARSRRLSACRRPASSCRNRSCRPPG